MKIIQLKILIIINNNNIKISRKETKKEINLNINFQ